ncbi:MAG: 4-aminobutyrate--2-oxoglutarate transaminase [Candidatus Eremiobacteraeota bacterium]|nr:4-aminobutyrate--2-oxoglutarate transaminase [Candidatus Eremiobacteraeota bacterium]MBC5801517.1 4-aminobutyrate--2-oxoglutarate transaminase [Candidatus Eremiobacteraeota bacterium]MBC5821090.1 4-aminobutyrate--2-oxoglutarate transaminase [Candidatus Eremiobacteraeota bacterium]
MTRSRTDDLVERRERAVARGVATTHPFVVARAEGARLWDVEGREYVDFAGGIGVMNLGHRHPAVVAAVQTQLDAFTHACFQVGMYEGYVALAERLNAVAPGTSPKKTLLLTTGAEATENAVKIAREATGRPAIVSFAYGYHGRTLLALSLTNKVTPYKHNFGPFASETYCAPFPDARRGWTTGRALQELDVLFETQVAARRVAAFLVEPVLGEGGFLPAPAAFLQHLRALCDRHGALLIADEVQTGFGRTGTLFAIEQAEVEPDLLCFAKSVAGGLPLAGVVGRADVMDAVPPGGLGGTFAGNPLACAAALATLEAYEREDVLGRAQTLGHELRRRLDALASQYDEIVDVRGLGAMLALEFAEAPSPGAVSLAQRVVDAAFSEGLIALTAGPRANVLRILVPLVATGDDLERGFTALSLSCARVLKGGSASLYSASKANTD